MSKAIEALEQAPRPEALSRGGAAAIIDYADWFFKTRIAALSLLRAGQVEGQPCPCCGSIALRILTPPPPQEEERT